MLRIRYSSDKAKYKLGKKFGCDPVTEVPELLKLAKSLDLKVVGISFHIGSSCEDYDVYCEAIKVSRNIFRTAATVGYELHILDLGGGFPGENFERIFEFSGKINLALDEAFPIEEFPALKIFSEPGRYFVESAFTLVTMIHSRKVTKEIDGSIVDVMYYMNEGVYSNFLFIPLGPEVVDPKVLEANRSSKKFTTTIWGDLNNFANVSIWWLIQISNPGPTCDSTDVICKDIAMELLNIDDIIYFLNMGAYTIPLRTPFNGLDLTKVLHFINFTDW